MSLLPLLSYHFVVIDIWNHVPWLTYHFAIYLHNMTLMVCNIWMHHCSTLFLMVSGCIWLAGWMSNFMWECFLVCYNVTFLPNNQLNILSRGRLLTKRSKHTTCLFCTSFRFWRSSPTPKKNKNKNNSGGKYIFGNCSLFFRSLLWA